MKVTNLANIPLFFFNILKTAFKKVQIYQITIFFLVLTLEEHFKTVESQCSYEFFFCILGCLPHDKMHADSSFLH